MGQTARHNFTLVEISKKGFRTEYRLKFNGTELYGKVVHTMRKGVRIWQTQWNNKSVDRYDPQWLCRKNNRSVSVPLDHPSMWNVKQAKEQEAAANAVAS